MGKSAQRPTSRRAAEILVAAAVVGTAVLALWWAGGWQPLWELFTDQDRVRRLVEETGPPAPWAYVLLLVVQAVVLPLLAPPVAIAGGYVFGTLQGFILTWMGVLLGGAASFGISRLFGRRFVAESVRAQRLDRHMEEHGTLTVFVLRLILPAIYLRLRRRSLEAPKRRDTRMRSMTSKSAPCSSRANS